MNIKLLAFAAAVAATISLSSHAAWKYDTRKDNMRGTKTAFAETQSINTVAFGFPYGNSSRLLLVLRKRNDEPDDVLLIISRGQFMCHDDCSVEAKFDNGEILTFDASGPDNGSAQSIFITDAERFVELVKKSKKLIIEANFYQNPPQQFSFDLRGIKWQASKQKPEPIAITPEQTLTLPTTPEKTSPPALEAQPTPSQEGQPTPTPATPEMSAQELLKKKLCLVCHDVAKKIVGPAYKDVAARYRNQPTAADTLAAKIRSGGKGAWGQVPMPPNNVSLEEAKRLAEWVLTR